MANRQSSEIKVWDVFIRVFHWLLVFIFIIAFITEDDLMLLHSWSGYVMTVLIGLRIIYGFIGTRYARFTNFIYKPTTAISYAKDVLMFKAKRYVGHNPAGGMMIVVLLLSLLVACLSGMVAIAVDERAGPLVGMLSVLPYWLLASSEDLHEFSAYFTLLLVLTHVAGVLIESIVHRENLVRSMINGRKKV